MKKVNNAGLPLSKPRVSNSIYMRAARGNVWVRPGRMKNSTKKSFLNLFNYDIKINSNTSEYELRI